MKDQVERSLFNYVLIVGSIIAGISSIGYIINGLYVDAIYGALALIVIVFLHFLISTNYVNYNQGTRAAMSALLVIILLGYISSSSLEDGLIYIVIFPVILPILRPVQESKQWVVLYYVLFFVINFFELGNYSVSMNIFVQIVTIHLLLFTIIVYYVNKNTLNKERLLELNAQLHTEATTDVLTGTMNRRAYNEIIHKRIQQFKRDGQLFSLAIFDIDHFKKVNDTFGHDAGDDALVKLSKLVREHLREGDILVRFGGEEFIVYMHDCNVEDAFHVMEKIRQKVEEDCHEAYSLTISIGVTQIAHEDDRYSLLKRADNAMYEAKNSGRNRTVTK